MRVYFIYVVCMCVYVCIYRLHYDQEITRKLLAVQ